MRRSVPGLTRGRPRSGLYHRRMRTMRRVSLVLATGVVLSLPASACGATKYKYIAPPGHAGATEYFEVIPTSQGSAAPPTYGRGSGSPPSALAALGHGSPGAARLAKLGKDGQSAAALARSTAPIPAAGLPARAHGKATSNRSRHVAVPSAAGGSSLSGVESALGGSNGLGALFPILLAASLVAVLGAGLMRVRRRSDSVGPGV